MNEGPVHQSNMIETTDCLDAVGVFRKWKNFFFLIVVICLLLAQACFWLVDTKVVEIDVTLGDPGANQAADPNQLFAAIPEPTTEEEPGAPLLDFVTFARVAGTVELVDGVLIVAASLYCLAMFFSLMVSLIGRLGGISHISRAFFLSLIMLVLIVPWQKILGASVVGAIYTPVELIRWFPTKADGLLNMILYYLRFSGYWVIVMLLLVMSQLRSARWTNAILRRLEII